MPASGIRKPTLQEIIGKVNQLPEVPQVVLRVSHMIEEANTDADDLASVIRLDANMTSQMLRLCNSAAYGFSRRITTVKEAVAILGFNTLKSMVYTIIAHHALMVNVPGYSLDKGDLWESSLTCAVYSKSLAERYRLTDPEQAFTAAILKDIGKLVIGEYVGANYTAIETIALKEKLDFLEAETAVIGFNHTVVGAKVAEKWNLPENLVKVIRYHHRPSDIPSTFTDKERLLITIVHLADSFTMMSGSGLGADGLMYSVDVSAIEANLQLNVDTAFIEATLDHLSNQRSVVQSLMDSLMNV